MSSAPAILRIDLDDPTPAYRQVANGLRRLLVDGSLEPGQSLPTVRRLGGDLGIHHNTVAEAYRLLAGEGWLELVRGRGALVLDRSAPPRDPEVEQGFRRRLEELLAEAVGLGAPRRFLAELLSERARALAAELPETSGGGD
jgi:DNA-binding transcriptional regulator YhcF (GntR family)